MGKGYKENSVREKQCARERERVRNTCRVRDVGICYDFLTNVSLLRYHFSSISRSEIVPKKIKKSNRPRNKKKEK